MKYMGSKRAMLANGLGETLLKEVRAGVTGFVDLFSGSGVVAHFVASQTNCSVTAVDMQAYGRDLAGSVIARTRPANATRLWNEWEKEARRHLRKNGDGDRGPLTVKAVKAMRLRCKAAEGKAITSAYGGHYFSEFQASWIDALIAALPTRASEAMLCRAALIAAASKCSASPGHTAQPLQPTNRSITFIEKAWALDPAVEVRTALERLAQAHANVIGAAVVAEANEFAWRIEPGQLVFVDPPYSAVQYSRFYHVLETIARGATIDPMGAGRYPPAEERPRSLYSMKGDAFAAITDLFLALSEAESTCVVTFPNHNCSNGLSAAHIEGVSSQFFKVDKKLVKSVFSTLGGTSKNDRTVQGRAARRHTEEMILVLRPK